MSLLIHLAQVPDFRQPGGNLRHKLLDILVTSVLSVLSGADDFVEMACFAERKLPVLRHYWGSCSKRILLANSCLSHCWRH